MERKDHPVHQQRQLKIICIGAGLAGLCLAYKLQRSFSDFSLIVYDKNTGIGGVWFENRYPGLKCDFPAHNYTYSFEPKADYPSEYASGSDIRKYLLDFSSKYDLEKYIKLGHEVIRAEWNERDGSWSIQVRELATELVTIDTCDIFINAGGVLNNWRWPNIKGLKEFGGTLVHSAKWNESLDLSGKSVAVIGNGSSGQQLVESIQPIASHLVHFIRQPTWVTGSFGSPPHDYTEKELHDFSHKPGHLLQKRKAFETVLNTYLGNFFKNSTGQAALRDYLTTEMTQKLSSSSNLNKLLIPNYAVGCRRTTPGIGYLEALMASNSETVLGEIKRVDMDGVIDSTGKKHVLDVIVCATGFDVSYKPRFPLIGEKNKNLQDVWDHSKNNVAAYLATAVPGFPNYFMFFGPGNPYGGGSFIWTVELIQMWWWKECQADYILKFCDRWQTENIHSFSPKQEVVDEFVIYSREILQKIVWTDSCSSWYKKGTTDSKALILWPGSSLHFIEAIAEMRADDWNIMYQGNRWAWLGNGFSQVEMDPLADKVAYLGDHDTSPFLSKRMRREAASEAAKVIVE